MHSVKFRIEWYLIKQQGRENIYTTRVTYLGYMNKDENICTDLELHELDSVVNYVKM